MAETYVEDEGGLFRRHRSAFIAAAAVVLVLGIAGYFLRGDDQPARKVTEFTMVKIVPPPPPPPPQQPLPEPKMITQPKMITPEIKQEHVDTTKPNTPAKGPLGLDTTAVGPGDSFNLGGTPGGNGILDGGGGSRWGWYASIVQEQISEALRNNPKTRRSRFSVQISIWADPDGHIQRVRLSSSTGDPELDRALENDVFVGLTLREPPPKDMPMPIVMRNVAQRPG